MAVLGVCTHANAPRNQQSALTHGAGAPADGADAASVVPSLVRASELCAEGAACLAGCHSLLPAGGGRILGDPMERATLSAVGWAFAPAYARPGARGVGGREGFTLVSAGAHALHRRELRSAPASVLHVHHRFAFSSSLRRMSVIATLDAADDGEGADRSEEAPAHGQGGEDGAHAGSDAGEGAVIPAGRSANGRRVRLLGLVKGAPEVMAARFAVKPPE